MEGLPTPSIPIGNAKGQNIALILLVVAAIAIVIFVVVKVTGGVEGFFKIFSDVGHKTRQALGIEDTPEDIANKAAIASAQTGAQTVSSPWSPQFYKSSPDGSVLIYTSTAQKLAKQIWDSVGVFTDDSVSGLAAFKQLKTQSQVSFLCDIFNKQYGEDLFTWLQYHYDTSTQLKNFAAIISYVDSLPKYKA